MIQEILTNTFAGLLLAAVGYAANELRLLRRDLRVYRRATRRKFASHHRRIARVETLLPFAAEPGKAANAKAQIAT